MGSVYADIELIDGEDLGLARRHIIGEEEIKRMRVNMRVGSGTYSMAINETIQEQLDLPLIEKRKAVLADGSVQEYEVAGPLHVKFKNRTAICSALVLRGDAEPLLGVIPMEEMRDPLPLPTIHPYL